MTDHNELVRRLLAAAKPERVFAGVSSRGAVYRTDKPKHHAILREAATAISAAESRAQAAEARCEKLASTLERIEDYLSSAIGAGTVDIRPPANHTRSEARDSLMVAIHNMAREALKATP